MKPKSSDSFTGIYVNAIIMNGAQKFHLAFRHTITKCTFYNHCLLCCVNCFRPFYILYLLVTYLKILSFKPQMPLYQI